MKGKPNTEKSEKNKSKIKNINKTKRNSGLNSSNLNLQAYDSKQKSNKTKYLQSSIKRTKNKNKFNSIKKESDNQIPSSEKFASSDLQSDISLKLNSNKRKDQKIKNSKFRYQKSDQLEMDNYIIKHKSK